MLTPNAGSSPASLLRPVAASPGVQTGGLERRNAGNDYRRHARLWDFCNARQIFRRGHIGGRIFGSHVANAQQGGGVGMSIDTLLLILILTFAIGAVLNRMDARRRL
jgi:hypothetical protein